MMGLTMMRMDRYAGVLSSHPLQGELNGRVTSRAKPKWRRKLSAAFDRSLATDGAGVLNQHVGGKEAKWALFILPFVTVLREGVEGVVFIGGVRSSSGACVPFPPLHLVNFGVDETL